MCKSSKSRVYVTVMENSFGIFLYVSLLQINGSSVKPDIWNSGFFSFFSKTIKRLSHWTPSRTETVVCLISPVLYFLLVRANLLAERKATSTDYISQGPLQVELTKWLGVGQLEIPGNVQPIWTDAYKEAATLGTLFFLQLGTRVHRGEDNTVRVTEQHIERKLCPTPVYLFPKRRACFIWDTIIWSLLKLKLLFPA